MNRGVIVIPKGWRKVRIGSEMKAGDRLRPFDTRGSANIKNWLLLHAGWIGMAASANFAVIRRKNP